jgi:predicted N-acetyltransferase YhbS
MLHFSFEHLQSNTTSAAKILDSAFTVQSYTKSFPHIFSEESCAIIACARTDAGALVGLCGIDTEFWSEPRSLRGACIGSVAVDPAAQAQGVGTALLRWVIQELREGQRHDFIYLFSEENRFYDSLGFTAVGRERLFALSHHDETISDREQSCFVELRRTTALSHAEKVALWQSLERMRLRGESHASWLKLLQVCTIPDLWVAYTTERSTGHTLAGGFVGKGIDFQGVMHNLFACSGAALNEFLEAFSKHHKELSKNLLIAPGLWAAELTSGRTLKVEQNLSYVLPLTVEPNFIISCFNEGRLYPRSLFSS